MQDQMSEILDRLRRVERQVAALSASSTIYLGDHEALTKLYTGHRIYVDTRDVGICSHLMLEGRWEPWVEQCLASLVKPGMCVVDAGANFGYYTLLLAHWVGAVGKVHSFEANPSIARKLRKSIAVNGFEGIVQLHELALLDREAKLDFAFTHEFSGGGAIGTGGGGPWTIETVTVPAAPLDVVLARLARVDVCKIDVEGVEALVLKGGAKLIERSGPLSLVIEFHAPSFVRVGDPPLGFFERFASLGFSISLVEPSGVSPPVSPAEAVRLLGDRLSYVQLRRIG
jgi:FkbM family methyltransferase